MKNLAVSLQKTTMVENKYADSLEQAIVNLTFDLMTYWLSYLGKFPEFPSASGLYKLCIGSYRVVLRLCIIVTVKCLEQFLKHNRCYVFHSFPYFRWKTKTETMWTVRGLVNHSDKYPDIWEYLGAYDQVRWSIRIVMLFLLFVLGDCGILPRELHFHNTKSERTGIMLIVKKPKQPWTWEF